MRATILCVAGGIGSGKTEVAKQLAARLDVPCVGFGNYVRSVAVARRIPLEREQLQTLGESLITEGWPRLCAAVLTQANWHPNESIVVEGVRHTEALDALATVTAPSVVVLVQLSASDETRAARLTGARQKDAEMLAQLEKHSTETQVKYALRDRADLIVDAERDVSSIVDEIAAWHARGSVGLSTDSE